MTILSLPPQVYERLEKAAQSKGATTEELAEKAAKKRAAKVGQRS